MNDVKVLLGQRIKELRKHCNISQQELSEKINIDQRNLSNIERGISFPSKSLLDIANALNIPLPELFDFEHINTNREQMITYIKKTVENMDNDQLCKLFKFIKIMR